MAELNKYQKKTITISQFQLKPLLTGGLGAGGSFMVKGEINISEYTKDKWMATIKAEATIHAAFMGEITPFSTIYLYNNGSQTNKKDLDYKGGKKTLPASGMNVPLGGSSFILPPSGSVEIELEVNYALSTPEGNTATNSWIQDLVYIIYKPAGKFLGKMRIKII